VAIAFTLRGPVGQWLCGFSAAREELTEDQIEGLHAIRLHDPEPLAGCDIYNYLVTVSSADGSSDFLATDPRCSAQPLVLFGDFDSWAQSTPCSLLTSRGAVMR
jgi:hypothetical protein